MLCISAQSLPADTLQSIQPPQAGQISHSQSGVRSAYTLRTRVCGVGAGNFMNTPAHLTGNSYVMARAV